MGKDSKQFGHKGKGRMQPSPDTSAGASSADAAQVEMLMLAAFDGLHTYICPFCDHMQMVEQSGVQHDAFVKHLRGCIKESQSALESHQPQHHRDTGRRGGGRQMKSIARFDPAVEATSWSSGCASSFPASTASVEPSKSKEDGSRSCPTPGCTGRGNTTPKHKTHSSAEHCPIAKGMLTDGAPTLIFNEDSNDDTSSDGSRAVVALADTPAGRAVTTDLMTVLRAVGLVTPDARLGWAGLLLSVKGGKDQVLHYDFHQNSGAFADSIDDPCGTCTRVEDGTEFVLHGTGEITVEDARAWATKVLGDGTCVPQNPPPFHRCLQRCVPESGWHSPSLLPSARRCDALT